MKSCRYKSLCTIHLYLNFEASTGWWRPSPVNLYSYTSMTEFFNLSQSKDHTMGITEKNKRLSILICSILSRKNKLSQLMSVLDPQTKSNVEVLVETDDGQMSIGAKRNKLLSRAQGDYVAFADDDDSVSPDYVDKILNAVATSPDCCSLVGEICFKKRNVTKKFIHSIEHDHWFEHDNIYYRCPNHLNSIRRELALQIKFLEKNVGEDHDFSLRILPLLKTEVKIEGIIYYYFTN